MFANHKYEELPNPKNQEMCNPISSNYWKYESIIVNPVVKMRPSSTSPLVSYIYKIIRKNLPQSSFRIFFNLHDYDYHFKWFFSYFRRMDV